MRTMLAKLVLAVMTAGTVMSGSVASVAAATVTLKPVEQIASDGYAARAATDAAGTLHIAFLRHTASGIWYTTNAGGTWAMTRISSLSTDSPPSIAVDGSARTYVSFASSGGIRLVSDRSGSWRTTSLTNGAADRFPAIAVDPLGEVHVAFGESELVYLTNRRGYWTRRTLAPSGHHPAIALDTNRRVHLAYESAGGISYLTDASGAWVKSLVTSDGVSASLAVRGTTPRIVFARPNSASGGVFSATKPGATWASVAVKSGYLADSHPFLALDPAGKAHVTYDGAGSASDTVEYATDTSGTWVRTAVGRGGLPSVAIGTAGAKLFVFSTSALYLRAATMPAWSGQTVAASAHDVQPDVAIGPDDAPRVVFAVPFTDPGLRIGTWSGSAFSTTRITSSSDTEPAIAIDADGHAHVAFIRAGPSPQLWYGTDATGSWVFEQVDESGSLTCPAIAIGAAGTVQLAAFRVRNDQGFLYPRATWYARSGATWTTGEELPATASAGCPDLALDATGTTHVVYENGVAITHAVRTGSSWTSTSFGGPTDRAPRIVVAPSGDVIISFGRANGYDVADGGFYVRTKVSGTTVTTLVAKTADVNSRYGLAVDATGSVHLAYRGYAWDLGLEVASNASGTWRVTRVRDHDNQGPQLAVTTDGHAHVVFTGDLPDGSTGFIHVSD